MDYYRDFEEPIPLEEANEIFKQIKEVAFGLFKGADQKLILEPCGAIRRKDKVIKDIDILITRNDD